MITIILEISGEKGGVRNIALNRILQRDLYLLHKNGETACHGFLLHCDSYELHTSARFDLVVANP